MGLNDAPVAICSPIRLRAIPTMTFFADVTDEIVCQHSSTATKLYLGIEQLVAVHIYLAAQPFIKTGQRFVAI